MTVWSKLQPEYAANMWKEALNKRLGTKVCLNLFFFFGISARCSPVQVIVPFGFIDNLFLHGMMADLSSLISGEGPNKCLTLVFIPFEVLPF